MEMYVCEDEPPFLLIINNDNDSLEIQMVWDALRIRYMLNASDMVTVETPIMSITLNNDKVIERVLDYIDNKVRNNMCHEAKPLVGITTLGKQVSRNA